MITSIKIAFKANVIAVNMMKAFAINNATDFTISVQCVLNDYLSLHVTMLANQCTMYFAVYSQYDHKMKYVDVDNNDLHRALNLLELRLQHALHKNPPTVNKELANIWNEYLSTNPTFDEYTLKN